MTAPEPPAEGSLTARSGVPASVRVAADWSWRLLLFVAIAALLVVVLGQIRSVVLPVFMGLLFAALISPLTTRLKRWRVPSALAALTGLLLVLIVFVGGLALIATSAVKQVEQLAPTLSNGVDQLRDHLQNGPLHLESTRVDALAKSATDTLSNGSNYTGTVVSGASAGVSFLGGFVLMMFTLFFFLKDGHELRSWCIRHLPGPWRGRADVVVDEVWQALTGYTRGAVSVAAFDAIFIGLGLLLLRVPLALLTFLAAFVPIVGAVVAGSVAVLVALASKGFGTALAVLAVVLVVQQLEGNVLQPLIMRRAVELHPVVVVISVAAGGAVAGVAGAALAVPVVAMTRVTISSLKRQANDDDQPALQRRTAAATPTPDHAG